MGRAPTQQLRLPLPLLSIVGDHGQKHRVTQHLKEDLDKLVLLGQTDRERPAIHPMPRVKQHQGLKLPPSL
jgi:hypothetical protein